jgi:hypothetical protein
LGYSISHPFTDPNWNLKNRHGIHRNCLGRCFQ